MISLVLSIVLEQGSIQLVNTLFYKNMKQKCYCSKKFKQSTSQKISRWLTHFHSLNQKAP